MSGLGQVSFDISREPAEEAFRRVADRLPHVMWRLTADGKVDWLNEAWYALVGSSPAADGSVDSDTLMQYMHPEDIERTVQAWRAVFADGAPFDFEYRLRAPDGEYRCLLGHVSPVRGEDGAISHWFGLSSDVTEVRQTRSQLDAIVDSIPQLVCIAQAGGRIDYANPHCIRYLQDDPTRTGFAWRPIVHPDDLPKVQPFWREALERGYSGELELRLKNGDGVYRWHVAQVTALSGGGPDRIRWYFTAADIHERKRAVDMLHYLDEAGEVLYCARDLEASLQAAAQLAVPRVADWCAIYIREENGLFRPAAIHHSDPAKIELARELVRRYPFSDQTQSTMLRTRQVEFYPEMTDEYMRACATDARHFDILRRLDLTSAVLVPLVMGEEVMGMLHLVRGAKSDRFCQADVDFAKLLGRRFAIAIDTAATMERERTVADTFQRAALPRTLPRLPNFDLDAVYVAGAREAEIGGDWYDAVKLADGSVLLSIGDVAGKGLEAAVMMASVRQAIRVAGLQGLTPARILHVADIALTAEQPGRFVTAFVARISADRKLLTYASAGHPAPVMRDHLGCRLLEYGGPPLGVAPYAYETYTYVIPPFWMMVMYTDGLIECEGDPLSGERMVLELVCNPAIDHAAHAASYLRERGLPGRVRDDTAILTIRSLPNLRWRFSATDAESAEYSRAPFVAWLAAYTAIDTGTAELIYGELVGNVVRHSPGPIDVDLVIEGPDVRLYVQDAGAPFDLCATLPDDIFAESGRGLFIANSLGRDLAVTPLPVCGKQLSITLPSSPI